ncbi:MAG: hypothetical protein QMC38_01075, partial [Sinobacterium sp.]
DADLRCFNGSTEISCEIEFVNAGFEFIGAESEDKHLGDQIAEINFNDVNLRAVKDDAGVCVALLDNGLRDIDLSYDCIDPANCKTPLLHGTSELTELNTKTVGLNFTDGIASLSDFNYADAGRLQLSAQALIDGVTIDSGNAQVDVVPAYLKLTVTPETLNYTGDTDNDIYTAAKDFTFTIGAYGANDRLLPNYQSGSLQLDLGRAAPTIAGSVDGIFSYAELNVTEEVEGEYNYNANYSEVGRIQLTVQDK